MHKILAAKPSITQLEIDYVTDAVSRCWGEKCYEYVSRFENELKNYLNVPCAWATSSGHGALHLALMSLGVGPGDEVIVPDATWTGSVFPINWVGANPVFVDVLPDSWCISPSGIEKAITRNTKAIVAVHLYGNLCEMDEIMAIASKHGIPVIEDAAEAFGSEYKGQKAGSIADFGVFSFHGTKTLTTGEGGALVSNREDMALKVKTLESQGRIPGAPHFWVDEIGLKYKMSNLQAALGCAQLNRADELVASKRAIFGQYKELLKDMPDICMNPEPSHTKNSFWMPSIVFGSSWKIDRNKLVQDAITEGVALRPFFYPVSGFRMYKACNHPVSLRVCGRGINLPNYYEMTSDDVKRVVTVVDSLLKKS